MTSSNNNNNNSSSNSNIMDVSFPRGGGSNSNSNNSSSRHHHHHHGQGSGSGGGTGIANNSSNNNNNNNKKRPAAVTADFLFGAATDETKTTTSTLSKRQRQRRQHKDEETSSKRSNSRSSSSSSLGVVPYGGGGVVHPANNNNNNKGQQEGWIEALGFGKLHAGMALLGVVRQVHDEVAVLALPNQWTGYLLLGPSSKKNVVVHYGDTTSIITPTTTATTTTSSLSCHQMVQVGQVLAVRIVRAVQETTKEGTPPRRRIQVTAAPHKLNNATMIMANSMLSSSSSSSRGGGGGGGFLVRGQVLSVEDHGLMVDLGWQRQGFCKFADIHGPYQLADEQQQQQSNTMKANKPNSGDTKPTRIIGVGRILDFHVITTTGHDMEQTSNVTALQLLDDKQARTKLSITNLPPLEDLLPGTLVQCVVDKLVRNGLCVSFGGGVYRGAIDVHHLGGFWVPHQRQENKAWQQIFDKHRSFKARIIAVDASTKIVRLSLQKHVLDMTMPPPSATLPLLGETYNGTVVRIDEGVGALLALPDLPKPWVQEKDGLVASKELYENESYQEASRVQCAYVHISKAMAQPAKGKVTDVAFAKEFAPSTKHRVRILNASNMIEGIVSGATAPDIVNAKIMSYADLQPGKVFKQVPIVRHLDNGALVVNFGMGITALVPPTHLFDKNNTSEFRIRMRKVKYALNAKIDVRVLTVDPSRKKCTVTAKKSLVGARDIITSYEDVVVGQRSVGFVSKIDATGISVTFFNGIFGRVTKRSLRHELGLDSASDQYSVGDVVSCQVSQIKKRNIQRVSYSEDGATENRAYYEITLTMSEVGEQNDDADQDSEVHIRTGTVLRPKSLHVLELTNSKTRGDILVPGYAIVEVKAKHVLRESMKDSTIECKLPYDQLFDDYDNSWIKSPDILDKEAKKVLSVGEKIDRKSLVMTDPKKSSVEYRSGTGRLTLLSLRPKLVNLIEKGEAAKQMLPSPETEVYVGAKVAGYVCRIDARYGAFVRFLDDLTGLVPKLKGGNELSLFTTVKSTIIAIDVTKQPPKILLGKAAPIFPETGPEKTQTEDASPSCSIGDIITDGEVETIDFNRAAVKAPNMSSLNYRVRIHCTMAPFEKNRVNSPDESDVVHGEIHNMHPFYHWKVGMRLPPLKVVDIRRSKKVTLVDVQVTEPVEVNRRAIEIPEFFENEQSLLKGQKISGIVGNPGGAKMSGLWVMIGPYLSGFLPSLEIFDSEDELDHIAEIYPRGSRISCTVLNTRSKKGRVLLTLKDGNLSVPRKGDTVLGRINTKSPGQDECSLAVEVAGGYTGHCCITELRDREEWTNLPLAKSHETEEEDKHKKYVDWRHGAVLSFKVIDVSGTDRKLHLSLRRSRMAGDLSDDKIPKVGEVTQAYVLATNKKGCFMRISRTVIGRSVLKNLSDGFLADPAASFPPGRLVVGKVTAVRHEGDGSITRGGAALDLNLRESAVIDAKKAVDIQEIEIGQKYHGTVSRIEDYGVFVQLEGSSIFGLVHKSECSDRFVSDVSRMYSPGDLVKVFVLKKDEAKKQIGLSMKASYFLNDDESDAALSAADASSCDDGSEDESQDGEVDEMDVDNIYDEKSKKNTNEDEADTNSDADDDSDDSESEDDVNEPSTLVKEMDVGFEWNYGNTQEQAKDGDESSSDDSESEDDASVEKGNHSRKNRSARRREEKHISEREKSLADGTADENPETGGDYERLVTSHPNSSELWIRYMAFHLSLADLDAARQVAERALGRIEFREEREKLNVWCALLTLEIKYGTEDSVSDTIKRACSQSNPKQVHLRVCEIMEKELVKGGDLTRERVDEMFCVTCKKFKSKKKVWIAHASYLLRNGKYDEALAISKRALLSLPAYKHTEMMSRMAQLMYENDRVEQARTVFDGLLVKNPKRLDLLSVYIDKEIKHGNVEMARQLLKGIAGSRNSARTMKLSEKQMKKVFKRWYAFEETHGTEETCDAVKQAAIEYVEGK